MKNKIIKFFLLGVCLIPNLLFAQFTQEWASRYNGPGSLDDYARSIAVDGSGNVYVTGSSIGSGTTEDYYTVKYNSSGVQQWEARYNGPGNSMDQAYSIAVDGSGNVYVTGGSVGIGTGDDYCTIKYNSAGVQQWATRYNGPGNGGDIAYSLAVDSSGNVYVTGESFGIGTGPDYATVKYNSSGVQQWVSRYVGIWSGYGYSITEVARSIAVDNSGNVYVTGWSSQDYMNWYIYDYATIKYNAAGVQQWVQRYNGPGNDVDYAYSIAVDGSGNVYITGSSVGIGTGDDYCTIKYNSAGVLQWATRYVGLQCCEDVATSLAIDGTGNVYVTGWSSGIGTGLDYATIKYNSAGVQQWVSRYNGQGNGQDKARSITIDGLGNVYVTGESMVSGTTTDYATIKYNAAGVQQWVQTYNGPGNDIDIARSIAVDGLGNVYVSGESTGNGTGLDYATIKYSQLVGITPVSNQIPKDFSLSQNYPNPFNPTTNIKFDVVGAGDVKIVVYDVMGREVQTLVNEKLQPGTYEAAFDGSQLTSGVYFYKITAGDFSETKKMLMIK
jgi:uncharacterized delta-60 repeat protein